MQMTGGEAVVRSLAAHGVDAVFGIPGTHNLAVYDALLDEPQIRHIVARHEQGAAFMADGHARASGHVGVCLSTTGPAALNTLTPLGTAYCDSSPVLCIASQIPARFEGQEKGFLHECRDQLGCFRPVTKWCTRAESVDDIPTAMQTAFAQTLGGRPRPVAVEVPFDVLDAAGDASMPSPTEVVPTTPDSDQLEQTATLLRNARRPVIWAGGGVIASGASQALCQMAELLQAVASLQGIGSDKLIDFS